MFHGYIMSDKSGIDYVSLLRQCNNNIETNFKLHLNSKLI